MTATALRPYQQKGLDTCDGVIQIAKNEMLIHGDYVTANVVAPELKRQGAVCGGHKACLVGSEYLAYGVKVFHEDFPGFDAIFREDFMRRRPGLRIAYEAINEAARRYALKGWPDYVAKELSDYNATWGDPDTPDEGWGEWFFEDLCKHRGVTYGETRKHVIQIVRNAKRLIRTGVVS